MSPNTGKNEITFTREPRYPLRHHSAYVMVFFFLLIILAGYIFFKSSTLFSIPELVLDRPSDGELIRGGNIPFRGATDVKTKVFINGYEVLSNDQGHFEITLPFQVGFHVLDIRAKNRLGKEARIVRHVVVE